jgi:hypothetical protein
VRYLSESELLQDRTGDEKISCREIGWKVDGTAPGSQAVLVIDIRGIILPISQ